MYIGHIRRERSGLLSRHGNKPFASNSLEAAEGLEFRGYPALIWLNLARRFRP
jgi:hypothetical protein